MDDIKDTGSDLAGATEDMADRLPGDEQHETEGRVRQDSGDLGQTSEGGSDDSTWAAEEARQDSDMTVGDRVGDEVREASDR